MFTILVQWGQPVSVQELEGFSSLSTLSIFKMVGDVGRTTVGLQYVRERTANSKVRRSDGQHRVGQPPGRPASASEGTRLDKERGHMMNASHEPRCPEWVAPIDPNNLVLVHVRLRERSPMFNFILLYDHGLLLESSLFEFLFRGCCLERGGGVG